MFFFFKQKTAYDMRISDWSSDVCSSDLPRLVLGQPAGGQRRHDGALVGVIAIDRGAGEAGLGGNILDAAALAAQPAEAGQRRVQQPVLDRPGRSEEHTSELQSLMRISYAVFCLKKKKNKSHESIDTIYVDKIYTI